MRLYRNQYFSKSNRTSFSNIRRGFVFVRCCVYYREPVYSEMLVDATAFVLYFSGGAMFIRGLEDLINILSIFELQILKNDDINL